MRSTLLLAALSIGLLAPACPSAPVPPDSGAMDSGSTDCSAACSNLAALGCAEGIATNCVATCQHAQASRITDLHVDALATATSKEAARTAGVRCP